MLPADQGRETANEWWVANRTTCAWQPRLSSLPARTSRCSASSCVQWQSDKTEFRRYVRRLLRKVDTACPGLNWECVPGIYIVSKRSTAMSQSPALDGS
eukprot:2987667-Rhodomonas_salina.1